MFTPANLMRMFEIYFINVEDTILFHVGISLSNGNQEFRKVSYDRDTIGYHVVVEFRHLADETKVKCLDRAEKYRKGKI